MLIDFKEIPVSNSIMTNQDIFEKFARDFFKSIGYEIENEPARGSDGGIDIKVSQVINNKKFFWLVSCKHYARTGKSITKRIETDIADRIMQQNCDGFIGFYSTIANTSLSNALEKLKNKFPYQLFDNEKIESNIVGIKQHENLFLRYFPKSYRKWKDLYYYSEPIKLVEKYLSAEYNFDMEVEVYKKVFGTIGSLIKMTRNFDDMESALKQNGITYLVVPEFENMKDYSVNYQLLQIQDEFIPKLIKQKFTINTPIIFYLFSINTDENSIGYAYNPNYFLVSPKTNNRLEEIFQDLKNMLN
jgi:hypothetical protein